ncbi:SPOR domain-containing protein [Dyella sp. LX-66]|uniref:SPOR domain-containing protein n=1 Tax=unclassified Dyella TaxID=2634549 RepID=UPI001BE067D4|nr:MULTISPECIES: SPOR domain-containing protein [unclassified Dyella]MBT2119333.1 SPOR domain-containing protein [Dyella sp. LX-1]MBT2141704.1 SPOR domain-containing protein [Dyella sp. LX-66]
MAARKGKGRQAVRNNSGGFPAWGWAIVGIAVGALLMFAMRGKLPMGGRSGDAPQPNAQATAQHGSDAGAVEPTSADSTPAAPKKPQFDFYSVLSEKEVRIPDAEISAQARAEQQKQAAAQQAQAQAQAAQQAQQQAAAQRAAAANAPAAVTENVTAAPAAAVTPPAAGGGGYLLQVGAFPSASDAESLKAKLALQGFVANVASVNVNGQTYNRVRLGPFKSATELESTKQRLSSAGFNAIALKEGR